MTFKLATNLTLPASAVTDTWAVRFWSKVDKGGPIIYPGLGPCWIWTAARSPHGYGRVNRGNGEGTKQSHRVALQLATGLPVPDELNVCHRCDNPPCVNPNHLFVGDQAANVADMNAKGRRRDPTGVPSGSKNKWAKLVESSVLEIRKRRTGGETYKALGLSFGVTKQAIFRICAGKCWRHLQ